MAKNKLKTKILLVAYINSHLSELIKLAEFLKKSRYIPTILYVRDQNYCFEKIRPENLSRCRELSVDIIDSSGAIMNRESSIKSARLESTNQPRRFGLIELIKRIPVLYRISLRIYLYLEPALYWRNLARQIKLIRNLYKKMNPSLVILPEENQGFETDIICVEAKRNSIPSLVFPYTLATSKEFAEALYHLPQHRLKGVAGRLAAFLYPRWVYRFKDKKLIFYPGPKALISKWFGRGFENPWILNGGSANKVLVESNALFDYFSKAGVSKERMVVVGSLSNDQLKTQMDCRLPAQGKPIILCCLPPPQFPRPKCDFKNYEDLVLFWARSLGGISNYRAIMSVHPRLSLGEMKYLEKYGVEITDKNVAGLIPSSNIYIASVSATIRWAIACSKPVLNYDVYKYRYHDYDSAGGVITVESKEDFARYLKKLTADEKFYQKQAEKQKTAASDWGILDGKSGKRIIKLIDSLCEK